MYVILWYNNWLVCKATPEVSRVIPSALLAPLPTSQTSCLCQRALSLFPRVPFYMNGVVIAFPSIRRSTMD